MAIIEKPLVGDVSGRIGNLVYYRDRGKIYVRSIGWKQRQPETELQRQQRNRMRAVGIFFQALMAAGLKTVWNKAARRYGINGYNLFVRLNIQIFSGNGLITDFSRIRLVTGNLPLPDMLEVRRLSPAELEVSWALKSCCSSERLADTLVLAFMKSEAVYTVHLVNTGSICRSACGARIELPESSRTASVP